MATAEEAENIFGLVEKYQGKRGTIIAILEDIQASYNYLPRDALLTVSEATGHSLVDLYGIATFYQSFSLEPRGTHLVHVCLGTACHVRGAPEVLGEFEKELGIRAGETTHDRSFTLNTVNCLGACALGPVAVLDGWYWRNAAANGVPDLIKVHREGAVNNCETDPEEIIHLHALCPHCNRSLMTPDHELDNYPMIQVTVSFGRKHGWMRLSSVWGDNRVQSQYEIPEDTLVNFFCSRCHAELRSPRVCPSCDAPTIPFLNKRGGIIKICSRRGCEEHMFDLSQ